MSTQFSKEAEDQLIKAAQRVTAYVQEGMLPDDAVVKVASDMKLGPSFVPLVVQGYNVGRTAHQRNMCNGGGVLCKMANFPIAIVENVMAKLYPEKAASPAEQISKTAVSREYSEPPKPLLRDQVAAREKIASAKLPPATAVDRGPGDPQIKMAKAYGQAGGQRRLLDEARLQQKIARDNLLGSLGQLADYFKPTLESRLSFAEVEYNAPRVIGPAAKYALDYAYTRNNMKEKRASGPPATARPVDVTQAPYSLIVDVIKHGAEAIKATRTLDRVNQEVGEKVAQLLGPFAQAPAHRVDLSSPALGPSFDKEANFLTGAMGGLASNAATNSLRQSVKPTSDLVSDVEMSLNDPKHMNELRQIQSRTMLNDFLANDELISGYDPDEVLLAYNEIVQLSPRAATQPAVMRPLLRKRLSAGSVEPFEAQQITDLEKSMRTAQTDSHTGVLANASPVLA